MSSNRPKMPLTGEKIPYHALPTEMKRYLATKKEMFDQEWELTLSPKEQHEQMTEFSKSYIEKKDDNNDEKNKIIPDQDLITCPISALPMRHPVLASDGHHYELKVIHDWVITQNQSTSPMTRALITSVIYDNSLQSTLDTNYKNNTDRYDNYDKAPLLAAFEQHFSPRVNAMPVRQGLPEMDNIDLDLGITFTAAGILFTMMYLLLKHESGSDYVDSLSKAAPGLLAGCMFVLLGMKHIAQHLCERRNNRRIFFRQQQPLNARLAEQERENPRPPAGRRF